MRKSMKPVLHKLYLMLTTSVMCLISNISNVQASQSCSDSTGAWGIGGDSWNLSHNANGTYAGTIGLSTTGAIGAIGKYPKCMGQQYSIVGGSRNGANVGVSGVQLGTVTGGQPNPDCPTNVSASVTMRQPGCDHGSAIVSLDGSGIAQEWTSQCFTPTLPYETIRWDSWDDLHSNPMKSVFKATLQPTSFNFGGRTVTETFPADVQPADADSCWFPTNGRYLKYVPQQADPVLLDSSVNNVYRDAIGPDGDRIGDEGYDLVEFYRSRGRAPCAFKATQKMTIDCHTSSPVYKTNALILSLGDATFNDSRDGVAPTTPRTYGVSQTALHSGVLDDLYQILHKLLH
jgi:hypothetical protein